MKKAIAGTFMAATFAVGLAAQTPAPQSQPPMQESKDAAKTVTVAGCLKAGDTADSFTLSDLKWSKDKAVGTSGTPDAPPIAASSLKLVPSGGAKLADHVGHQVEVTGTIGDKADKGSAAPTDPAARPAPASGAQASLNVRNVRMIAASCTP
jgi:hypothetical protein